MAATRKLTPWMWGVGGVTFLAGLLFGYDQGVISGALPLLQADLDLSTLESEIVTSWVTLGALFGALVAGGFADFSFFCVVTYVFVWWYAPETGSRSLEEIQERWVVKGDRMLDEEPA